MPHEPTTPHELRQERKEEKQEERQEAITDKQFALRLHKMIKIGMSREQVRRLMGYPDVIGSPEAHYYTAADADFYAGGDYEVDYSASDTVLWFGRS